MDFNVENRPDNGFTGAGRSIKEQHMGVFPAQTETEAAELMANLGITRVPADQYRYKAWRYSNLGDAVAQAKRDLLSPNLNQSKDPA